MAQLRSYITSLSTTHALVLPPFSMTMLEALTIVVDLFTEDEPTKDHGKRVYNMDSPSSDNDRLHNRERRDPEMATHWSLDDQWVREERAAKASLNMTLVSVSATLIDSEIPGNIMGSKPVGPVTSSSNIGA